MTTQETNNVEVNEADSITETEEVPTEETPSIDQTVSEQEVNIEEPQNTEEINDSPEEIVTDDSISEDPEESLSYIDENYPETGSTSSPVNKIIRVGTKVVEPTDPSEPTDPTDPTEPTEPTDPTDPKEPTEPAESIEHIDSIEQTVETKQSSSSNSKNISTFEYVNQQVDASNLEVQKFKTEKVSSQPNIDKDMTFKTSQEKLPDTGESQNALLPTFALVLSLLGSILLFSRRKKSNKNS